MGLCLLIYARTVFSYKGGRVTKSDFLLHTTNQMYANLFTILSLDVTTTIIIMYPGKAERLFMMRKRGTEIVWKKCAHTHTYTHTTYTYTHTHTYKTLSHTHTHTQTYHIHPSTHTHIHTHLHTLTHTYTHTHLHTHTHTPRVRL
jgi:hypothetical protein